MFDNIFITGGNGQDAQILSKFLIKKDYKESLKKFFKLRLNKNSLASALKENYEECYELD